MMTKILRNLMRTIKHKYNLRRRTESNLDERSISVKFAGRLVYWSSIRRELSGGSLSMRMPLVN